MISESENNIFENSFISGKSKFKGRESYQYSRLMGTILTSIERSDVYFVVLRNRKWCCMLTKSLPMSLSELPNCCLLSQCMETGVDYGEGLEIEGSSVSY